MSRQPDENYEFDFSSFPEENVLDEGDLWEQYRKLCFNQNPPIPAVSLMRPVLQGAESSINFSHYGVGPHLPVIITMLKNVKNITELNLTNNSINSASAPSITDFIATAKPCLL